MSASGAGAAVMCSACGIQNPGVARFCMSCGATLEIPCPNCGTELPPAAKFCFSCGFEIEAGATAEDAGSSARAVTDEIADELRRITSGVGERRTITLLFCDVVDSTATAERLDPEAWSEIMHDAMDCFVSSVERYGGTVARLLGDAILAYFGAPVAHEDDPQRAILSGLAILECSRDLGERVRATHGTDFDVRIGINTGLVVVGDMGSEQLTEYAALGDAANVAARMEHTAEPGTIRIAEPTHRLVGPLFETAAVGSVEVKGRAEPVVAYTVRSARGRPGQVRGIEGLTSPLVGRDEEVGRLAEALDATRSGTGRIVSVMGEAGLGKSRLVAEVRANHVAADGAWVVAQCHSYEDTIPYGPFIPAIHGLLGLDGIPDPERTEHVIDFVIDVLGGEGRERALYLCTMLGLPLPPADQRALGFMDPGTMRERVFDAVEALLAGLASDAPLVVEVEDLHWADPTSVDLTQRLLGLADRAPVTILLLFRPRRGEPSWGIHEAAGRHFAHRHVTIQLAPLGDDDAKGLVANLLRVEGLSVSVRDMILRKSEGNPFFVEEVIRSLLDTGVITRQGDRFVATADLEDLVVPDTLSAVLTTRLDRLDPAIRLVVQTAAVLGREFSREMLALLAEPDLDLDDVLADLQRRELIIERRRDPEVVLAFRHELTRDTAYNTLLRSVRRDLHRVVGKLVEERHPEQVFDLARHFTEADDHRKAVPYLVAAGEQSFTSFACADAVRYLRRALELWDESMDVSYARGAYETLGNALMFLGQMDAAIGNFDEMLTFAREHGDVTGEISALNKGGLFSVMGGDEPEVAEAKLLQARELADATGAGTGLAEFHVGYCYLNVARGDLDKAEEHLGEAAEVCFVLDSHYRNFGLLHYADALIYQTRFDEARDAVARSRAQSELDEDLEHLSGAMTAEGLLQFFTGRPAAALPVAVEGLELAARIGNTLSMAKPAWAAGASALALGQLERARDLFTTAVTTGTAAGYGAPAAVAAVGLGILEQWFDGPERTDIDAYFAQARELFETPMGAPARTGVFAQMGIAYLRRQEFDRADAALTDAAATPSAFTKLFWPEVLICGGGVAFARGDVDLAGDLFRQAAELVDDRGLNYFRPRVLLALAMAADDDTHRMRGLLDEAERDAIDRELRLDAVLIQRTSADLLAAHGFAEEAAAAQRRAGDTVAEIAAMLDDAELRRRFLRANVHVN